ncbi:MAG: multidrug transporter, partial [Bacteroides sp.]|nr:multidrug transporter [Bacteroides sp.]MBP9618373.1 multidrug transporter [Bacteroides sp.]
MNAVAIGVAAAISVKFRQPETGTLTGCIGMLCLSVCVMIALYNGCGFWTYELLMFALLFTMGLTFTSSTTLAMDSERRYAGAASALLGALCFASGGIVSPLVGLGNILVST